MEILGGSGADTRLLIGGRALQLAIQIAPPGTLRLFARMLRDIWERQLDLPLITAGDVDWSSERIQADLLNRLNRDGFKAAVDSDVLRHARQLDQNYATDIHRRVAAALMLESLPATTNAAMDRRDLTLAVLRPSEVGHEAAEAMDRLMSVCWYTYPCEGGRYQFRYEPNINKLIEERAEKINVEDAKLKVLTLLRCGKKQDGGKVRTGSGGLR